MKNDEKELNKLERIGENMNVSKKTIEIWKNNLKKGYRFFQPNTANQLTPRTLREADAQKNIIRLLQRTKTV